MGKYENDKAMVDAILAKGIDNLTAVDRMQLLNVYKVSYHDTGKIEGTFSCDSSCHGCTFCQQMRKAAEKDPSIICGRCYDARQEEYRTNVKNRHSLNLRIMASVSFTIDELKTLPSGMIDRINSSGDIENEIHAGNMLKYAIAHSASFVGFWTKNYKAMEKAIEKYGKPQNVIYIASSIHINKKATLPKYADYTFTVYDKEHIAEALNSESMECNGKKCKDCGYKCYFGTWPKGSDIAELLR